MRQGLYRGSTGQDGLFLCFYVIFLNWRYQGLNIGPLACKTDALPLSNSPFLLPKGLRPLSSPAFKYLQRGTDVPHAAPPKLLLAMLERKRDIPVYALVSLPTTVMSTWREEEFYQSNGARRNIVFYKSLLSFQRVLYPAFLKSRT